MSRPSKSIYTVKNFTKISGFRRVVTCRSCGKRVLLEKESSYCNECAKKAYDLSPTTA